MAARVASYMRNVAKSVGYSAIEVLKDCNPTITAFGSNNSEVLKDTYTAITHMKKTVNTSTSKILDSKVGDLGRQAMSNIKEDLRTGKLYNMERKNKAEQSAANSLLSGFDDDFDFDMDDSGLDMGEDEGLDTMMDLVGKKSSEAVSQAIVQSTEQSINVQTKLAKAAADQNQAIYANLHAGMSTINENLGKLIEFANGPMTTHMENSRTYFENSTRLAEERNSILKEMLELQKNVYTKKEKYHDGSSKITMSDIIDEHGAPNLSAYASRIKKNIKNNSGGTFDMMKEMMDMGVFEAMIASPLEALTTGLVKTVIPGVIKNTMKDFNKTLSGVFSTTMAKIMNTDSINPAFNFIKEIFGVGFDEKKKMDLSRYEKGAVPFDGIVRKSIIEVIPSYLARIESAISKTEERRFNFETGKFMSISDIKEKHGDIRKNAKRTANFDIYQYLDKFMQGTKFESEDRRRQVQANIDILMDKSFETGVIFNPQEKHKTAKSLGLKGKDADNDLMIIRKMFESIPREALMSYATEVYEAKERITREMLEKERRGDDISNALFNNSLENSIGYDMVYKKGGKKGKTNTSGKVKSNTSRKTNRQSKTQKSNKSESGDNSDDSDPNRLVFSDGDIKTVSEQAAVAYANIVESSKEKGESFMDMIDGSNKVTSGVKSLVSGIQSLINTPANFLAGIIKKADTAVYQMIFGVEYDENGEVKSVASAIFDGLKEQFKDFRDWAKKLLHPISDYFNREGTLGYRAKNAVTGFFGKDTDNEFVKRMRGTFGSARDYVKGTVKDTVGKGINEMQYQMAKDPEKYKEQQKLLDRLNGVAETEDTDGNAAAGMKRVKKTGVIAVSEGEMIIPPDMNPYNIDKRTKNENRAKKSFVESLVRSIPGFAAGGDVDNTDTQEDLSNSDKIRKGLLVTRIKLLGKMSNPDIDKMFTSKDLEDIDRFGLKNDLISTIKKNLSNIVIEGFHSAVGNTVDKIKDAGKRGINAAKGKVSENNPMTDEQKQMVTNAFREIKRFAPEVTAGAIMGTGVSFITGAIGGPLLGAAVGSAISLLKNSTTVNEMLFGKMVDGKRDGSGLLSKELTDNFQKYAPSIGKGATLGAITSILPFVPGGPVAGAILGSAIGFASQNEGVKNALFGEEDSLFGKEFPEKVKKALPALGIGAAAGFIAGPFGTIPNILLGSAGGFAATTDKFKDFFFGKEGDDGNRHGGLLEKAVQTVFKPITDFTVDTIKGLTEWADKNIKQPLIDAIDPIKTQFKLIFKSLHDGINNFFERSLGATFDQLVKDKLLNPIGGFVKKVTGLALSPIKMMVAAPFKMIGGVGNFFRNRQIKRGNADYMSADERLAFREQRGVLGRAINNLEAPWNIGKNKKWKQVDSALSDMDRNTADTLSSQIKFALDKENTMKHSTDKAYDNFSKNVRKSGKLNSHQVNMVAKELKKYIDKDKDPIKVKEKLHRYLGNIDGLSEKDRDEIVKSVDTFMGDMAEYKNRADKFGNNKQKIIETLQKEFNGAKINEKDLPKLMQYLDAEAKAKNLINDTVDENGAPIEKNEQERHTETINILNEINNNLSSLVDADKLKAKELGEEFNASYKADAAKGMGMIDWKNRLFHSLTGALGKGIDIGAEGFRILYDVAKDNGITGHHTYEGPNYWRNKGSKDKRQLAAVSEGEAIVSPDDDVDSVADSIPNFVSGGIVGSENDSSNKNNKEDGVTYQNDGKGHLLRYYKGSDGKPVLDKSDSDTAKAVKEAEEDRQEQKNFFQTMIGLPGSLVGKIKSAFFGEDAEKEKKEKKGIFSKILSFLGGGISGLVNAVPGGGSTLAAAVGVPLAVGAAKNFLDSESGEKLKAKVGEFAKSLGLDEKFNNLKEGIVNKLGEVKDGIVNWLAGGPGAFAGGFPGLLQAAVEHWATGFEFIATTIMPKAVEILVSALPNILIGVGKGIAKIISTNFHNIIHGGEGSNDLIQEDKNTMSSVKLSGITSANGSHVMAFGNYSKSSDWQSYTSQKNGKSIVIKNGIDKMGSGIKLIKADPKDKELQDAISNANSTYNELLKYGDVTDYKTTDEYNNLSSGMQKKLNSQLSDMAENGKNVIRVNIGTEENPDWRYKTLQEVLGSDDINIGTATDENGNIINLTGRDLLENPTLAGSLGLDWQLSNEERQANKEEMGIAKDTSLQHTMLKTGLKQFLKGQGNKTLLGKLAKGASKVPVVGKMASAALGVTDKVVSGAGKLGSKVMPGWLIGQGTESAVKNGPKHKLLNKFLGGLDGSNDIIKVGNIAESGKHYSELSEAFLNNSGQTMTRAEALSKGLSEEAGEFVTTKKSRLAGLGEKLGVYKPGNYGTKVAGEVMGDAAEEVAEGSLESVVKGAAEGQSKGIISKITDWVFKHLKDIANNGFIVNKFGEGLKKAGKACSKEAVDAAVNKLIDVIEKKAMPEFLKKLSKASAKTLGKIAGKIASGGIIGLLFSGTAFVNGFRNAETTLGVIADNDVVDYDPSFSTKLISGLCAFANETFFQGLVPLDLLFNILYPVAKELFDIDPKDTEALDKARAESQSKLKDWNMENDTNATIQEYNDKDKITTKLKNKAKDFFLGKKGEDGEREGGVVGAIKGVPGTIKDTVLKGIQGAKDLGSKAVDGVKNAGKTVIGWGNNILETGMDIGKTIGDSTSNAFNYATYQSDKKAADSISIDEKDPMYGFAKILSSSMDVVFSPIRGIYTVGRGISKVIGTVVDFTSEFASQVKADAEQGIKDFNSGDIKSYFRFGSTEINAEGEVQHNPLSPLRVAIKAGTRLGMLMPLAIGYVGKKIAGGISKVIDGIANVGSTIGDAGKTSLDAALHGTAQEYLTVENADEGDTFGWLNKVINVGARVLLSPVFGIAQVGKGISNGVKTLIDGAKTVFDTIANVAKDNIDISLNGSVLDYFTTTADVTPFGWLNTAITSVSRALMLPVFTTIKVGKGVADGTKTIISGARLVFDSISSSASEAINIAKNGSLLEYFNILDSETGTTPFGWLNTAITGVTRVVVSPVAAVIGAGRMISSGVKTLINGARTVFNTVSSTAQTTISKARSGSLSGYFDFTSIGADGEFSWMNTALTGATRVAVAPIAGAVYLGSKIRSAVVSFLDKGKGMLSNINKDREYVSSYYNKDSMDSYWSNPNATSEGFFGSLEKIMGGVDRVINMPFVFMRQVVNKAADAIKKPIEAMQQKIKDIGEKAKNAFGFGDDTSGSTVKLGDGGSGSGLSISNYSGRGSGSGVFGKSDPEYAKDSAFTSQLDSRYANKRFNVAGDTEQQTIRDSGCGPAAAAMVVNDAYQNNEMLDMKQASKDALRYKVKDGGVNASYFENEFAKYGMSTQYMVDDNKSKNDEQIINNLRQGNRTVLMGADQDNDSKANSPFGPDDHYIVATRVSPDGKYMWVNDPESTTPEVKYPTSTILRGTKMGVSGIAANGSGLLNRIHARGSSTIGSVKSKLRRLHGRGKYGPDTYQYKVWTKLRGAGYNEIATAAAMGNIQHECGFDPNLVEKGSGVGYGLVQWSYGRRNAFEAYAGKKGVPKSDINIQIEYLLTELAEGSGIWQKASSRYGFGTLTRADWANGKDIDTATKAFMCCFERPSYSASINHIDRRLQSAREYLQEFAGIAGDSSVNSTGAPVESNSVFSTITEEAFSVFDDLAVGYGLKKKGSSSSSSSSGTSGGSDKQNALVDKMKSVQGQLAYSQSQRNPDTGSGDCSSTVQWAYKNVLGVDPGSWTGAQETNGEMTTITEGFDNAISDPSKLQPGDLILFRRGGTSTHVEMYAGNNEMIGHGGGADGKKKGPTIKPLTTNFGSQAPYMVRRYKGFVNGASATGSGLLSGRGSALDPSKDISFSDRYRSAADKYVDDKGFLRKSRYTNDMTKNLKVPAGMYAAGSDLISTSAPGNNTSTSVPTVKSVEHDAKLSNDKYAVYLAAITKLLAKEVQNSTMLSTIVTILTELVKIVEEERNLKGSESELKQQREALQSKRESMMNILNATGIQSSSGMNDEISRLIRETERLARL